MCLQSVCCSFVRSNVRKNVDIIVDRLKEHIRYAGRSHIWMEASYKRIVRFQYTSDRYPLQQRQMFKLVQCPYHLFTQNMGYSYNNLSIMVRFILCSHSLQMKNTFPCNVWSESLFIYWYKRKEYASGLYKRLIVK